MKRPLLSRWIPRRPGPGTVSLFAAALFTAAGPDRAAAQLFDNLQSFGARLKVGDPAITGGESFEGPKGIATADLNGDTRPDLAVANIDGTVTVFFGLPDGKFSAPLHLGADTNELRGIACADFTGDGLADILTASPYAGQVFLFRNRGGAFDAPTNITAWPGARNLAAGDFDGDGQQDFVVAGTTNGVRHYRGLGNGVFEEKSTLAGLGHTNRNEYYDFPKPFYAMQTFRPQGQFRDEVVLTHAESRLVWVLGIDPQNVALRVNSTIQNQDVYALDVGSLTQPRTNATVLDLVTAQRNSGSIEIHAGEAGPTRFADDVAQRLQVPGGPRAVQILDLDGDGWNDLAVVLRNFDRVLVFKNSNGVLRASSEMPVGISPREMVTADFNADSYPDLAVMNRDSMDVSVLITYPGQTGFAGSDRVYPVDGEVAGLLVARLNGDNRADVIQLHRASAEISVRLAEPGGHLGAPAFYPMGMLPTSFALADANGDGQLDVITANLGRSGVERGSISVRLGDGQGAFSAEDRFVLPENLNPNLNPPIPSGRLFSLQVADLDGDGTLDLVAGFFDCRLAFFRGQGDGTFAFAGAHFFVYEARGMAVGDFDGDGDVDVAGAGYAGHIVVLENTGHFLDGSALVRTDYPPRSSSKFGTKDIVTRDVNFDGDLDLVVASGSGAMLFLGGPGMSFTLQSDKLPGTDFPAAGLAMGDFDGDGKTDLAVSCRLLSCVTLLTRDANNDFLPALSVDVPSGGFLASGDIDGDGFADLIGSGNVLWTALSGSAASNAPPMAPPAARSGRIAPVINEILAINSTLGVDADGDRFTDWVELFNGSSSALTLNGWKLRLVAGTETNDFAFPATAFFGKGAHLLVLFSETRRTPYHTGFKLPGEGGTLLLLNPAGVEMDRVEYGEQQPDVSFARYRDGFPTFVSNAYPGAGLANDDNGPLEPVLELTGIAPASLQANTPIRFFARGADDTGIVGVSILWQRMDVADTEVHRAILYDDGMHEDGGVLDGLFSGTLAPGLPPGAEIQFYVEVVDLSDRTVILPDEPVFAARGSPTKLYTLALRPDATPPPVELAEVLAFNISGITDERGTNSDWIEVRNTSAAPVSLAGLSLQRSFFATTARYLFPATEILAPGEHRVIFCDSAVTATGDHAPFKIDRGGGEFSLCSVSPNGARALVDHVSFGRQTNDVSWARLGRSGSWRALAPTPRGPNVATWLGYAETNGASFIFAFPTELDRVYTAERTDNITGTWSLLGVFPGDGLEQVVTRPLGLQEFFRVKRSP